MGESSASAVLRQLANWARSDGSGIVFDSSTGFALPNGAKRSPDVAWVKRERWDRLTPQQQEEFPPLCPNLVVEVRSPSDDVRLLWEKMAEYVSCGAQLGWLLDPKGRGIRYARHDCDIGGRGYTWNVASLPQSALEPAGREAQLLAELFWWMTAGATVIWLAATALTLYAAYVSPRPHRERGALLLIVIGGVAAPVVVLAVLLAVGLAQLPGLLAPPAAGSLRILITGEQWWWRVRYLPAAGAPVDLANEIRLPVGEPVDFQLESADVIHSFWIPSLGGKMDMIPGRRTRLTLHPTREGTYRGACAEYCGGSHAWMAFAVVVHSREEFQRWLAQQAEPAAAPTSAPARLGAELFIANGCGACHTIRGSAADGVVGPDLTHVGGRLSLAAGALENDRNDFRRWIAHTYAIKPEVHMPAFGMLPPAELEALAVYLDSLQ